VAGRHPFTHRLKAFFAFCLAAASDEGSVDVDAPVSEPATFAGTGATAAGAADNERASARVPRSPAAALVPSMETQLQARRRLCRQLPTSAGCSCCHSSAPSAPHATLSGAGRTPATACMSENQRQRHVARLLVASSTAPNVPCADSSKRIHTARAHVLHSALARRVLNDDRRQADDAAWFCERAYVSHRGD
jgi:hypothetical protein